MGGGRTVDTRTDPNSSDLGTAPGYIDPGHLHTQASIVDLVPGLFFDVVTYGAKIDGVTDDTVAFQAAVTAAGVYGGVVVIPSGLGNLMVSKPIVMSSRCVIQGSGPNDTNTNGQCMIEVLGTANPADFPAGFGVLTLTCTRATIRDFSINGNGIATNELSMTHSEGTVRHLVENVSLLNKSTGPALWNIGCEDCTFVKLTIAGSEATPGSLPVAAVMSCPQGLVTFVGCDVFGPIIFNCSTVAWFGGNLGGVISSNPGATQSRSIGVYGAWVYDGGTPFTFCPVDCCAFSTTGTTVATTADLTDANGVWSASDVGKNIVVFDAATGSVTLSTTIATYVSATHVTLTESPAVSLTGTAAYYYPGGTAGSGIFLATTTLVGCHVDCAVVQSAVNGALPSYGRLTYKDCLVSRLAGNTTGAGNPTYLLKTYSAGTSNGTLVVDGVNYAQSDGSHVGVRTGGPSSFADDLRSIAAPGSNVVQQNNLNPTVSMAASGTSQTNTNTVAMYVTVTGGTVTEVDVNGYNTGATSGTFLVPAGGTIKLTYSAPPTWTWNQYLIP